MVGLALLVAMVFIYFVDPYPVRYLRLKTFDFYQQMKPREIPPPAGKPVTIIDLDEESLAEIGQWPWSRAVVGKLIRNLMQMGAGQVAFDVVFAEPDRMNPNTIPDIVEGLDEETAAKLRKLPSNDSYMAKIVKQSRVVLGQAAYWEELETTKGPPVKKSVAFLKQGKNVNPELFLPHFKSLIRNVEEIEKNASGHGIFSLLPEPDGIVRRVPTIFMFDGQMYPSLTIEMMRVAFNRKSVLLKANAAGVTFLGVHKNLQIPTDAKGRVWPYFSKMDKSKYVSARDVLNGTADPAMIKGKLTLIGTSAVGLLDIRAVPTEPVIPGVEVHAQLIEAALHKAWLDRPNYFKVAEMALLLFGGLMMIVLVPWMGAKWTLLLFLVLASSGGGTSWYLFTEHRMLFDSLYAIGSILLLYTTLTYINYAREEAQKKQTRDAFSKYLSPDMVKRVAENPDELKLGGEQRDMTLLFCDVRGFTTISEQFDAVGLTGLINKLLTPLTNVILARQGTIDKYMGDCIMAFWNAPMDDDDQEYNGCTSALAMLAEMGPLNERLRLESIEEGRKHIPLKVGLGLNTGPCVVGNMGSDMRFDYSVLGDAVNLAARLESGSKNYGMNVVLGPTTRNAIKDRLATIDLDFIQVKGKTSGTYIYALMGGEEVLANPQFIELRDMISNFMDMYRSQKWDDASFLLNQIRTKGSMENKPWDLEIDMDVVCDLYEERILEYKKSPPPENWDGVFIATSK